MLAALLAVLMLSAICQLAFIGRTYIILITNTEITARFTGGIRLGVFPQIEGSGYVRDKYYETALDVNFNYTDIELEVDPEPLMASYAGVQTTLTITNDIDRFTGEDSSILFADGYDSSCLDTSGEIVIIGKALAEAHRAAPGDTIILTPLNTIEFMPIINSQVYKLRQPNLTNEEIIEMYKDEIVSDVENYSDLFTMFSRYSIFL